MAKKKDLTWEELYEDLWKLTHRQMNKDAKTIRQLRDAILEFDNVVSITAMDRMEKAALRRMVAAARKATL